MAVAGKKRFRIAFSFASEKRDFVAKVAAILAKRFSEAAILYDKYSKPSSRAPISTNTCRTFTISSLIS
jgi:hypothetical protein